MKDYKLAIILFIAFSLIIYLAFAFVQWDLNALHWGIDKRGLYIMLCLLFYAFIPLIITAKNL